MSLAQQLKQEGLQKGRQEGRRETLQSTLLKQLTLRFGKLNQTVTRQVEGASEAQLEQWTERVIFAQSAADVLQK